MERHETRLSLKAKERERKKQRREQSRSREEESESTNDQKKIDETEKSGRQGFLGQKKRPGPKKKNVKTMKHRRPRPRLLGPQSPHQRCGLSPPRLSGPSRIVPCPSGSKAGSFVLFLSLSFSVAAFGQRPRLRPLARRPLPGLRGPFAPLRPRGGRTEGALLEVFLGEALRELCPAPRGARRPLRLCRRRRFEVVPGPKAPKKRTEKRDGASRGAPRPPRASSTDTLLLARADAP